ncbi:MAG: hypothetical protein HY646_14430 [Acidobacteria bacterium]|nr:hypothetical protein [Acidobacteriota bacterium]
MTLIMFPPKAPADAAVETIGGTITIDGESKTVVGVKWRESRENRSLGGGEDKRAKREIENMNDPDQVKQRLLDNIDRHLTPPQS